MTAHSNGLFWSVRLCEIEPQAAREELGPRLRKVRQQRLGLTLAEFGRRVAEVSGRQRAFSNVTVANWESGRQEPSFATIQAIARLAELPLSYFAGVGDLDDYPRVDWFAPLDHSNDARLRRLLNAILELPLPQRRLATAALQGLVEGLARLRSLVDEEPMQAAG